MTHDPTIVDTLPSGDQVKKELVANKRLATHVSLIWMQGSGMTVSQVECYIKDEVRQHYLRLKSEFLKLLDKVCSNLCKL